MVGALSCVPSLTPTTRAGSRFADAATIGWSSGSRVRRTRRTWPRTNAVSRAVGTGFGFGIFFEGRFVGEITLSSIQRGPLQSAFVGYWIDESVAGLGLMPESVVTVLQYAFDTLRLHRVEINIIPRNAASRRVVEKLGLRFEGIAERYLEIDGAWEDHAHYAITSEEWSDRAPQLVADWLLPRSD